MVTKWSQHCSVCTGETQSTLSCSTVVFSLDPCPSLSPFLQPFSLVFHLLVHDDWVTWMVLSMGLPGAREAGPFRYSKHPFFNLQDWSITLNIHDCICLSFCDLHTHLRWICAHLCYMDKFSSTIRLCKGPKSNIV